MFRCEGFMLSLWVSIASLSVTAASPSVGAKVAVPGVRAQGLPEGTASVLTEVMVSEASRTGGFQIFSQSDLESMLGFERQKTLLGCTEESCLSEIGAALGVDYLLIAQVGRIGTQYRTDLRLIDAKKAVAVAREGAFCPANEDALAATVQRLTHQVFQDAGGGTSTAASQGSPRTVPLIVLGSAGVLLAGGAVSGILALGDYNTLSSQKQSLSASSYAAAYAQTQPGMKTKAMLADVLFAAGIVTAGVGGYLLFFGHSEATVSLSAGPQGAGLVVQGHFP
jgi:TolB-like protein